MSAEGAPLHTGLPVIAPLAQNLVPVPPQRRGGPRRSVPHGRTSSLSKSDAPSSLVTRNHAKIDSTRLSVVGQYQAPLPPTEAARGGQGLPWRSGGICPLAVNVTGSNEACAWVSNQFSDPKPRRGTKVKAASGVKRHNSNFLPFPIFWNS